MPAMSGFEDPSGANGRGAVGKAVAVVLAGVSSLAVGFVGTGQLLDTIANARALVAASTAARLSIVVFLIWVLLHVLARWCGIPRYVAGQGVLVYRAFRVAFCMPAFGIVLALWSPYLLHDLIRPEAPADSAERNRLPATPAPGYAPTTKVLDQLTISGTVLDELRRPVAGAGVTVEYYPGATTQTDSHGHYLTSFEPREGDTHIWLEVFCARHDTSKEMVAITSHQILIIHDVTLPRSVAQRP
jgi:hypothetical protein